MGSLDRMLSGVERMAADYRPMLGGERFLTDKEVAARLKISRRTLQDIAGLPQRGQNILLSAGRQNPLCREPDRENAEGRLWGCIQEQTVNLPHFMIICIINTYNEADLL